MDNYLAEEEGDWEVTDEGLYMATRGFLIRRGYCCANQCRNCPYINWRDNSAWRPVPHEYVRRMRVSSKAIVGALALLSQHEELVQHGPIEQREDNQTMIDHYSFLLEQWGAKQ